MQEEANNKHYRPHASLFETIELYLSNAIDVIADP